MCIYFLLYIKGCYFATKKNKGCPKSYKRIRFGKTSRSIEIQIIKGASSRGGSHQEIEGIIGGYLVFYILNYIKMPPKGETLQEKVNDGEKNEGQEVKNANSKDLGENISKEDVMTPEEIKMKEVKESGLSKIDLENFLNNVNKKGREYVQKLPEYGKYIKVFQVVIGKDYKTVLDKTILFNMYQGSIDAARKDVDQLSFDSNFIAQKKVFDEKSRYDFALSYVDNLNPIVNQNIQNIASK